MNLSYPKRSLEFGLSFSNSDPSFHAETEVGVLDCVPLRSPSRLGFRPNDYAQDFGKAQPRTIQQSWHLFQAIDHNVGDNEDLAEGPEDPEEDLTDVSLSDGECCNMSDFSDSSVEDLTHKPTLPTFGLRTDANADATTTVISKTETTAVLVPTPVVLPITPPPRLQTAAAMRHAYTHRGHSRSSLMHTKWFWLARRAIWMDWDTRASRRETEASDTATIVPPTGAKTPYDGIEVTPPETHPVLLHTQMQTRPLDAINLHAGFASEFDSDHGRIDHDLTCELERATSTCRSLTLQREHEDDDNTWICIDP